MGQGSSPGDLNQVMTGAAQFAEPLLGLVALPDAALERLLGRCRLPGFA